MQESLNDGEEEVNAQSNPKDETGSAYHDRKSESQQEGHNAHMTEMDYPNPYERSNGD